MSSELLSPTADELRHQMRGIRHQLSGNAERVVTGARELVDWRTYVAQFPWVSVTSAVVAGFWLVPSRSRSTDAERLPETVSGEAAGLAQAASNLPQQVLNVVGPVLVRMVLNTLSQHVATFVGEAVSQRREPEHEHERGMT